MPVTFTITGPSSGPLNQDSSAFTVTPSGPFTGTIYLIDGEQGFSSDFSSDFQSSGGAFTPPSLQWSGTSEAKTFVYKPVTLGLKSIGATDLLSVGNQFISSNFTAVSGSASVFRDGIFSSGIIQMGRS